MRNSLRSASSLLALFAISLLSACGGGFTASQSSIPNVSQANRSSFAKTAGAQSVLVITQKTTVHGTTKLPNLKVELWLCKTKDWILCVSEQRQRTTVARGMTNKDGRTTLSATFSQNQLLCAVALWAQKFPSGGFRDESVSTCHSPFPKTVIVDFGQPQ
jgi:5-hydroxyisourate hydrolase-like protein (transthyretin family)